MVRHPYDSTFDTVPGDRAMNVNGFLRLCCHMSHTVLHVAISHSSAALQQYWRSGRPHKARVSSSMHVEVLIQESNSQRSNNTTGTTTMLTKQIFFAVLACASFVVCKPISLPILEDNPLEDDCVGKGEGADCKALVGVLNVPGKCQDSIVSKSDPWVAAFTWEFQLRETASLFVQLGFLLCIPATNPSGCTNKPIGADCELFGGRQGHCASDVTGGTVC